MENNETLFASYVKKTTVYAKSVSYFKTCVIIYGVNKKSNYCNDLPLAPPYSPPPREGGCPSDYEKPVPISALALFYFFWKRLCC